MKKLYLILLFLTIQLNLHAENRFSISASTAQRETTLAEAVVSDESEFYFSLEAFFSVDALSGGDLQQGPVVNIFDITNEDDSYSDYFHAGWQFIWEFRENLEIIGSAYAVFERAFYDNSNDDKELKITLKDGYGAKLALRVAVMDDFGFEVATGKFEVDESGNQTRTYEENSLSLVWWF